MTTFATEHLDTLRAVVDEGTFEAAAQRLHLTQSAVSQRIKQLERTAGQVLLRRTTPVVPTAAGDVVLRYARQVDLLGADVATALGGTVGAADTDGPGSGRRRPTTLAVAVNADSLATWFLEALAGLAPEVAAVFDLRRADQVDTAALLRSGDVLAAVTSTREAVQGCTTQALGSMRYRAVASPAYVERWLGGRADVARADEAPMLVFDRADVLQHDFVRGVVGYDPRSPHQHVPASADFARAAVLGLGWGLLPEAQAAPDLAAGRLVELAPDDPVDVPLFWQRWTLASPLLDAVTEAVVTTAREALRPA